MRSDAVLRVHWVPGTDHLLGTCHCGALPGADVTRAEDRERVVAARLADQQHSEDHEDRELEGAQDGAEPCRGAGPVEPGQTDDQRPEQRRAQGHRRSTRRPGHSWRRVQTVVKPRP
ncbi:hypothetical protein [Streptomyces sp. NPDC056227]|uniref:hypothetical protein n=1 Tax=Streptomyces sp. NPDC056227 TaxID=3345753 RepID=UPI0035D62E14